MLQEFKGPPDDPLERLFVDVFVEIGTDLFVVVACQEGKDVSPLPAEVPGQVSTRMIIIGSGMEWCRLTREKCQIHSSRSGDRQAGHGTQLYC